MSGQAGETALKILAQSIHRAMKMRLVIVNSEFESFWNIRGWDLAG